MNKDRMSAEERLRYFGQASLSVCGRLALTQEQQDQIYKLTGVRPETISVATQRVGETQFVTFAVESW